MKASFFAVSNIGLVRTSNEDAYYNSADGVPMIFAVFDGMGGLKNGRVAAEIALAQIDASDLEIKKSKTLDEIDDRVEKFVSEANENICSKIQELTVRMGTTFALVVITEKFIKAYNIGDSRIYILRNGFFSRISEEHTLAEQKVQMGILTPEQAECHPDRHKLTRHLGVFEDEMIIAAATSDPISLDIPCRLLLCTDGLTDMVEDSRIEEVLRSTANVETTANTLLKEALANGGIDNITCIVVDVGPSADIKG